MPFANLLIQIKDEELERDVLHSLKSFRTPLLFEQHKGDWNSLLDHISKSKPEILLLDLSAVPSELNIAIRQLRYHAPRLRVVALHTIADPQIILSAMRAGASEFLHMPLGEMLEPALEHMVAEPNTEGTVPIRGKVIGFLSAKGGCGATTLACHVASELQQVTQKNVLLADFDLTSGMLGFLMKTPSSYSVLDAIKNLSRLDHSLWKALIVERRPGLAVMPAPASYTHRDHPDENRLQQVLQFMRTQHDWVVLDLGRSLNSIATALLEEIDQLFLVSTLEVVALHGLKAIVHGLFEHGEKLQLLLNRTPKMMDISVQELEKILGRSLYAALPNDYMGLYQSYSSGNLLESNSRLGQEFTTLASKISGVTPVKNKKKFGLFG
ncbi:MAG TPA: AAA family ATPase [Bryobacteraceae bacterium]|nr:AAA family ATPase [Bryobacteraceae bacterium]